MDSHRIPVVNLQVEPNGQRKYSTFFEGIYEMADKTDNEFGIELLLNLGNFSSLRMIAKRHEENSDTAGDLLIKDVLALKEHFLRNSEQLLK